ncbi:APC family permease [Pseudidiomarina terrestris]|uniref:Amino acid permease n=1 Tax=Pseudidiomarina terrestris TaxID=2820060 RepID=A0AAW7QWM4_9GAMM|nr:MULTISPECIES: APC family permease [unclassified Pseudidiomarina]MDN7124169.1 amino acid permease [Pseudidiomarina sp. 1APP75-32.1]MDN7127236.1 amino acid permease [Pseudidiomarina sp. 1APR75-33.1]MDN7128426.1 amino acid permease [Pseudidiomarina sp. 1APR75-15]MDN7135326.1 amino acid permease [Pseudidiomarina sp. 1ASP75-5]
MANTKKQNNSANLQRTISFPMLVLYGMGTMVGAGFFALAGKVAGVAGMYAPVAFGIAGALALFSALAFAELSSRLPHAGGSARYIEEAFGKQWLSAVIGWMIIATGIVSSATLTVATVRFIQDFVSVPEQLSLVLVALLLGGIAAWGVRMAVGVVVAISLLQIVTLLYVVFASLTGPDSVHVEWTAIWPPLETTAWVGVLSAAFLAFYAFIGFEDMVTMAEEVRDVRESLPVALVFSLILAALLYMSVSAALVLTISPETLAEAKTPLAAAVQHHGTLAVSAIGVISILSAVNSALVQIMMVARVAYGMADRNYAPKVLGKVSKRTQTPWLATVLATLIIALFAATLELTTLANATSLVLLAVFSVVNFALWWLKGRDGKSKGKHFNLPRSVPLFGALVSAAALLFKLTQML